MAEKIGEQLIKLDLLSFEQAERILRYQKTHQKQKFVEIAIKLGFLDKDDVILHREEQNTPV